MDVLDELFDELMEDSNVSILSFIGIKKNLAIRYLDEQIASIKRNIRLFKQPRKQILLERLHLCYQCRVKISKVVDTKIVDLVPIE